jgi:hypothetical protein
MLLKHELSPHLFVMLSSKENILFDLQFFLLKLLIFYRIILCVILVEPHIKDIHLGLQLPLIHYFPFVHEISQAFLEKTRLLNLNNSFLLSFFLLLIKVLTKEHLILILLNFQLKVSLLFFLDFGFKHILNRLRVLSIFSENSDLPFSIM